MFYSHSLLSRKGPLGAVWVAAYCHKRLKKAQVKETDIPSSVDMILLEEVPVVTYRVLGYLLLGVVRIYSKKVEYLFYDCHDALVKIKDLVVNWKDHAPGHSFLTPCVSIALPHSFELDAFEFEIMENTDCMEPHKEITLKEAWNDGFRQKSFEQFDDEEFMTPPNPSFAACAPMQEVPSLQLMDIDMAVSHSHVLSNFEASLEKFRHERFDEEECMDFDMYRVAEKETVNIVMPSAEVNLKSNWKEITNPKVQTPEKGEQILNTQATPETNVPEASGANWKEITVPEIKTPEKGEHRDIPENHPVLNIEATPETKVPKVSVTTPAELMVIHTPVIKEHVRTPRKRKCLFDEVIVLPNEVLRESIHSASLKLGTFEEPDEIDGLKSAFDAIPWGQTVDHPIPMTTPPDSRCTSSNRVAIASGQTTDHQMQVTTPGEDSQCTDSKIIVDSEDFPPPKDCKHSLNLLNEVLKSGGYIDVKQESSFGDIN
ncbi:Rad21/Rec8-like protein, N-terminal, partial [Dillenia turbinata]